MIENYLNYGVLCFDIGWGQRMTQHCKYCKSMLLDYPDDSTKLYCPNEMCLFDELVDKNDPTKG